VLQVLNGFAANLDTPVEPLAPNFGRMNLRLDSVGSLGVPGVPQGLALCSHNRLLVTDVENHRVHVFKGEDYGGLWGADVAFHAPRAILAARASVFVLDQRALHKFDEDGRLRQRGHENTAHNWRGLARAPAAVGEALVTVETTEALGVKVIMLSCDINQGVIKQ